MLPRACVLFAVVALCLALDTRKIHDDEMPQFVYNYCQANLSLGAPFADSWRESHLASNDWELVQVQLVVRHGDRLPVATVPGDTTVWVCPLNVLTRPGMDYEPMGNERVYRRVEMWNRGLLLGNCSLGYLTDIGYQQHYLLGQALRELYVEKYDLIDGTYSPDQVYVRAVDIPRTFASAGAELDGLFPSTETGSPIIPINTMDSAMEDMSPQFSGGCPAYSAIIAAMQQTPSWQQHQQQYMPLYHTIAEAYNLSWPLSSAVNSTLFPFITTIFDNVMTKTCHDLPLPKGITNAVLQEIIAAAQWTYINWFFAQNVTQLSIGVFMSELVATQNGQMAGNDQPSFFLYSGQDISVGPVLSAMGVYDNLPPPYASHVSIELWQSTSQPKSYAVRVLYNGKVLTPPGCSSSMCPYNEFLAQVTPYLLTQQEYTAMCFA